MVKQRRRSHVICLWPLGYDRETAESKECGFRTTRFTPLFSGIEVCAHRRRFGSLFDKLLARLDWAQRFQGNFQARESG